MPVVAILSQKGGAGKTTLATNLAVYAEQQGHPTVVFDLDPQATAAKWGDSRKRAPDVVAAQAARLPTLIETAKRQGAELILLDGPPNADATSVAMARAADLVFVPCRPSAFDLGAIGATLIAAVEVARKPTFVIINAAPPRSTIADEAARSLLQAGVKLCPVRWGQRIDYVNPLANGGSATEWNPKGKAAEEVASLWTWLCQHTHLLTSQFAVKPV
jgi:chromosome partitioning protein